MPQENYPDTFASKFNEIERRLRALETAPRLPNTSQRGGTYKLLSEDGNVMFKFGTFTDPETEAAEFGISVYDKNGSVVLATSENEEGWLWPQQYVLLTNPTPIAVTSASFVAIFEGTIDSFNADVLTTNFAVSCPVGTTGEVRIANPSGTTATTAVAIPSGANGNVAFNWLHPYRVGWGDPTASVGGDLLQIQARRTAGAGSVSIYPPRYMKIVNRRFISGESTNGGGFFI